MNNSMNSRKNNNNFIAARFHNTIGIVLNITIFPRNSSQYENLSVANNINCIYLLIFPPRESILYEQPIGRCGSTPRNALRYKLLTLGGEENVSSRI